MLNRFELQKCQYCGRMEEFTTIKFPDGRKLNVPALVCNCQNEQDKLKEEQKVREIKQSRLKKLMAKSLMKERFLTRKFDNWHHREELKEAYECVYELATNIDKHKSCGILLVSDAGCGKTHLAAAACNELLLNQNKAPLFYNTSELMALIESSYKETNPLHDFNYDKVLRDVVEADLVVLNDFGKLRLTDKRKETLFSILEAIYESMTPCIITINTSDLERMEKDKDLEPIIDRIKEMCFYNTFLIKAGSYRPTMAKNNVIQGRFDDVN